MTHPVAGVAKLMFFTAGWVKKEYHVKGYAMGDDVGSEAMKDSVELRQAVAKLVDELGSEALQGSTQRLYMEYFLLLAANHTARELALGLFAMYQELGFDSLDSMESAVVAESTTVPEAFKNLVKKHPAGPKAALWEYFRVRPLVCKEGPVNMIGFYGTSITLATWTTTLSLNQEMSLTLLENLTSAPELIRTAATEDGSSAAAAEATAVEDDVILKHIPAWAKRSGHPPVPRAYLQDCLRALFNETAGVVEVSPKAFPKKFKNMMAGTGGRTKAAQKKREAKGEIVQLPFNKECLTGAKGE